jgi:hypothetical protein
VENRAQLRADRDPYALKMDAHSMKQELYRWSIEWSNE